MSIQTYLKSTSMMLVAEPLRLDSIGIPDRHAAAPLLHFEIDSARSCVISAMSCHAGASWK